MVPQTQVTSACAYCSATPQSALGSAVPWRMAALHVGLPAGQLLVPVLQVVAEQAPLQQLPPQHCAAVEQAAPFCVQVGPWHLLLTQVTPPFVPWQHSKSWLQNAPLLAQQVSF